MARTCIHELDSVALTRSATGYDSRGREVEVPAGTAGTVVREHAGSSLLEVEVTDDATGQPRAFVEIDRSDVRLVRRLERTSA